MASYVAQLGAPFTLMSEAGTTVTDADILTRPTLLYMGNAFCPDVCPMDNLRIADVIVALEAAGLDVQAVFLSVDPARDTPQVLSQFTDVFHPEMIGLTGTDSAEDVAERLSCAIGLV